MGVESFQTLRETRCLGNLRKGSRIAGSFTTGAGARIDASPMPAKRVATTPAADVEIAAARACAASQRFDRPSTPPHISPAVVLFLPGPRKYQRTTKIRQGI